MQGVEKLIEIMSFYFEKSAKVQQQACWAILTLAGSDEIAHLIIKHKGDEFIMRAMTRYQYVWLDCMYLLTAFYFYY